MTEKQEQVKLPWFLESPDPGVYLGDNWVCLDFETTNLDKGSALNEKNDIVLATWQCGPNGGVQAKEGGIYDQVELCRAVQTCKFIVCHNAKFELQWLARMGVETSKLLVYDTMLGQYVLAGNRRWKLDLDSVCRYYGIPTKNNLVKTLMAGGVCPSDMPRSVLREYGKADTENTTDVFLRQRAELDRLNLLPVHYTRCLTAVVLADIETRGVCLDAERAREEFSIVSNRLAELELSLHRLTGGINPSSTKQLGQFLYTTDNKGLGFREHVGRDGKCDRTASGKPRTDADSLSRLKPETTAQQEFLDLILERQDYNKRHQILKKMMACVENDNGILYARFNQTVTQTHRLSSSGARYKLQFQNFHRPYKKLFRARRGADWLVGEADGAQLEFRVAAHLGRDQVAIKDIRDKLDVHTKTAQFYLAVEKPTKEQRQDHKPKTFEPMYGKMYSPDKNAQKYIDYFHDRYCALFDTQTEWTYEVLKTKELVTEWGMRFYWPDTELQVARRRGGKSYITNTTSIFNYPPQCFATAEIIPISLVFLWHRMKGSGMDSFIVNTVHDSIIAELNPSEKDLFSSLALQSLTYDTYDYLYRVYHVQFTCPLGAEVKIGEHWGEGDGESWDVEPPTYH